MEMARYEIKSLSDSKQNSQLNETLPREGLVNEVCREWLMHEDQALAYRLQSEEYQHHLGHNRQKNAILRKDTPRAKEEQLKEDEEAAKVQMELEIQLARQEARDAAVVAAIVEDLDRKEREKRRLQELKDEELAKKIVEEEKNKVRQRKEIRQVEREAAYLGINSGLDNVAILSRKDKRGHQLTEDEEGTFRRVPTPPDDLSDLSDFCIKPSSSMDEEEMRRLQENQDEELARLLQEQDLKRRGDLLREDQLLAIEAQDKELAKVLQEQERAKSKKAREKARQKAFLKRQQQQHSTDDATRQGESPPPRPPKPTTPPLGESSLDDSMESPHYATIITTTAASTALHSHRPNSPQYATPMLIPRMVDATPSSLAGGRDSGPALPEREQIPRKGSERAYPIEERSHDPFTATSPSAFPNIACAIDPTYQRRVRQGELPPSLSLPPNNHPQKSPTSPGPSKTPVPLPVFEDDDDDYLPPPYMPIQGQRRTSSLEKRKAVQKPAKDKGDKSGCKQQ